MSFLCSVIQKDEEGQVLKKRKSPCDTIQSTKVTAGPSAGNNMSDNFHNCASVKYNARGNEYE